jgi:predicted esterase
VEKTPISFICLLSGSANTQRVVQVVVDAGVADPSRIAVGGHSYGAFMAANLLAHAGHLFAAGIARSGAYNRCGRQRHRSSTAL